jgi:UPF0271 protein
LIKELYSQKPIKLILDASAFIGIEFPALLEYQNAIFYTTPSVVKELKDFRSKSNLEVMIEIKDLSIVIPESKTLSNLKHTLKSLDPDQRLSPTDSDVLSLTKDLGGILVSGDLALQNIASLLGIKINNISGKMIKNQRIGKLKCTSCWKIFRKWYSECPECGGSLKGVYSLNTKRLKMRKG